MNAGDSLQVEKTLGSGELLCPHCASEYLVHRNCKSICESCGYVESCEDNFIPNRANPVETFG